MHQCASAPARLGRHDCDRSRESEREISTSRPGVTEGDNLGCQPWLLVAPGLGHPWPLVIGRHPWPSGDILGCCHRPSALPPALLTSALVPRAPGSASGRGSASAGTSVSTSTSAPALLSALPPALLTSASVSRAPGHQYRCQRREWRRGPKAGEGRGRICSTLVSPSGRARIRERR